jgi:hypothetical protein
MYKIHIASTTLTAGPQLKHKRWQHSCGRIRTNIQSQDFTIIVAGGYDESTLSSVEILDLGANKWRAGPFLPFGMSHVQMVEDPSGGVVLIGGRSDSKTHLDTLYQLPHAGADAGWTKMEQKLKIGRFAHTAFLVPDDGVDCS